MKLRKFTGNNTREVLRIIRQELGGDAMIVSSRQTSTGVEMIAMSSTDAQSLTDPQVEQNSQLPSGRQVPLAASILQTHASNAAEPKTKRSAQAAVAAATQGIQKIWGDLAPKRGQQSEHEQGKSWEDNPRTNPEPISQVLDPIKPNSERSFLDFALSISPAARELIRRDEPVLAPKQAELRESVNRPELRRGQSMNLARQMGADPSGLTRELELFAQSVQASKSGLEQIPQAPFVDKHSEVPPNRTLAGAQGALPEPPVLNTRLNGAVLRPTRKLAPIEPQVFPQAPSVVSRPIFEASIQEPKLPTTPPPMAQPIPRMQPQQPATGEFANGSMSAFSPINAFTKPGSGAVAPVQKNAPTLAASLGPFIQVPLQQFPQQGVVNSAESAGNDVKLADAFRSMREFLAEQWAGFAWRDATLRHPSKAMIWRDLTDAGFSPALARALAEKAPDNLELGQIRAWLQDVLARNLQCSGRSTELVEVGGKFALVGPTGVGKTTTTAKIAARCVIRYGTDSLGLISSDTYRIGAQDQLRTYGKVLGVPVHAAQTAEDLGGILSNMANKRLVLVDAMGISQRDERLAEQSEMFAKAKVQRQLVLSASSQPEALDEVIRAFMGLGVSSRSPKHPLHGAMLSKMDESVKLGCALDAAMRYKLAVQYVATGQRVPEDLHLPNPSVLVHKALRPRNGTSFRISEAEYNLIFMPTPPTQPSKDNSRGY